MSFKTKEKLGQFRIMDWCQGCLEGRTLVGLMLLSISLKQAIDNQMVQAFQISPFNFFKMCYQIFTSGHVVVIMSTLPADFSLSSFFPNLAG